MTSDIFLCFHCGARNHAAERWQRIGGKCEKCGTALFPEKEVQPESESNYRSSTFSSSSLLGSFLFKVLALLVIVGMLHLSFAGWRSNKEKTPSAHERLELFSAPVEQHIEGASPEWLPEQQASLSKEARLSIEKFPPAVVQHTGVMWNKTALLSQAPLKIQTSDEADYYIKLVDVETNHDAMAFYVVGGKDLDVLVPLGSYKIRYAYGKIWRGEQHLFGPGKLTKVGETLKSFDFSASLDGFKGYTVKLTPQIGSNLPIRSIARSKF